MLPSLRRGSGRSNRVGQKTLMHRGNMQLWDQRHIFGDVVSVNEVLWSYLLYDFALKETRRCLNLNAPDPDRYDERVAALLRCGKPWPENAQALTWTYEAIPRSLLATIRTPWRGLRPNQPPSVSQVVDRMEKESRVALAQELGISQQSFAKIEQLARDSACGYGPSYCSLILLQKDQQVFIIEGAHRLCAVWQQFGAHTTKWPKTLAAFVGQ